MISSLRLRQLLTLSQQMQLEILATILTYVGETQDNMVGGQIANIKQARISCKVFRKRIDGQPTHTHTHEPQDDLREIFIFVHFEAHFRARAKSAIQSTSSF